MTMEQQVDAIKKIQDRLNNNEIEKMEKMTQEMNLKFLKEHLVETALNDTELTADQKLEIILTYGL